MHRGIKYFSCYLLQAFTTEEILKCNFDDFFKIIAKKGLKCLKKVNMLDSKINRGK